MSEISQKPDAYRPNPIYEDWVKPDTDMSKVQRLHIDDGEGPPSKFPIRFHCQKPADAEGNQRDQTGDAAEHMRYAATLNLPQLFHCPRPRLGRAIVVGGAPSTKDFLKEIKELAADPLNAVYAINWSHTWLIENGIIPTGCVFFEIDAEPDSILQAAHKDVTYYICSHCHPKTFDALQEHKRVLWHTPPNSEVERLVGDELFHGSDLVGGGISTFTRTITVALYLGYRHFDLFGCDSSFPDDGNTHVDGYETIMDAEKDGFYVYARDDQTGLVKRFKTLGYLALQHEEFKEYCRVNHAFFSLRVYGDSLLRWTHECIYPDQYK